MIPPPPVPTPVFTWEERTFSIALFFFFFLLLVRLEYRYSHIWYPCTYKYNLHFFELPVCVLLSSFLFKGLLSLFFHRFFRIVNPLVTNFAFILTPLLLRIKNGIKKWREGQTKIDKLEMC